MITSWTLWHTFLAMPLKKNEKLIINRTILYLCVCVCIWCFAMIHRLLILSVTFQKHVSLVSIIHNFLFQFNMKLTFTVKEKKGKKNLIRMKKKNCPNFNLCLSSLSKEKRINWELGGFVPFLLFIEKDLADHRLMLLRWWVEKRMIWCFFFWYNIKSIILIFLSKFTFLCLEQRFVRVSIKLMKEEDFLLTSKQKKIYTKQKSFYIKMGVTVKKLITLISNWKEKREIIFHLHPF